MNLFKKIERKRNEINIDRKRNKMDKIYFDKLSSIINASVIICVHPNINNTLTFYSWGSFILLKT